jgi:hypothetical protein
MVFPMVFPMKNYRVTLRSRAGTQRVLCLSGQWEGSQVMEQGWIANNLRKSSEVWDIIDDCPLIIYRLLKLFKDYYPSRIGHHL